MFLEMEEPQKDFKLPALNTAPQNRVGGTGITFSLSEGLQWKVRELSIYTRLFHRLMAHSLKKIQPIYIRNIVDSRDLIFFN